MRLDVLCKIFRQNQSVKRLILRLGFAEGTMNADHLYHDITLPPLSDEASVEILNFLEALVLVFDARYGNYCSGPMIYIVSSP